MNVNEVIIVTRNVSTHMVRIIVPADLGIDWKMIPKHA